MSNTLDEILGDLMIEVQENMLARLNAKTYDTPGDLKKDIKTVSKAKAKLAKLISIQETKARIEGQMQAITSFHNQGVIDGISFAESMKQCQDRLNTLNSNIDKEE